MKVSFSGREISYGIIILLYPDNLLNAYKIFDVQRSKKEKKRKLTAQWLQ